MVNGIFKKVELEDILQRQWGNYLDHLLLMRMVMEHVRDTSFKEIMQQEIPPRQVKMSVTKVSLINYVNNTRPDYDFEIWVEFTIPKENGVVVGTSVYFLNLNGDIRLDQCFGTWFRPEIS